MPNGHVSDWFGSAQHLTALHMFGTGLAGFEGQVFYLIEATVFCRGFRFGSHRFRISVFKVYGKTKPFFFKTAFNVSQDDFKLSV